MSLPERVEATITNNHRYAVHVAGRRFRPGRPRTLLLTQRQLFAIERNSHLDVSREYEEEVELSEMTVVELRQLLEEEGLDTSGKKNELVDRLTEHYWAEDEPESDEAEEPEDETEEDDT